MDRFLEKHAAATTGTLSCFDRLIIKGHLPLGYPRAMEEFLSRHGILFKDLKAFVLRQAERIKTHSHALADRAGRPWVYCETRIRKETEARKISERDGVTEGLVCVFAAIEPCRTFQLAFGQGRPSIKPARRKCLFVYFYFIDPKLGLIHVRIQTWFPFTIQVYVNGHEWLARQMDARGIRYRRIDNAFVWIEDPKRAQRLADNFAALKWPTLLDALARRVNPLLRDLLSGYRYYWATNQSEYATNVMFTDRAALRGVYPHLLRHATLSLGAEDVLTFLGRKLYGQFQGEVLNEYKERWPGARVKHWMKENWIKMYDKHGSVLRIETVINDPYEFKVRRMGKSHGVEAMGWHPMPKGVANLPRYAEVSLAANRRYLDALAVIDDPTPLYRVVDQLARPAHAGGRAIRGFNPVARQDLHVFQAVLRGEHAIQGFRNRNIRERLFPSAAARSDPRSSARTSRILKRLHVHGMIAKIPRSRRWRVTAGGNAVMSAALRLCHEHFPDALRQAA